MDPKALDLKKQPTKKPTKTKPNIDKKSIPSPPPEPVLNLPPLKSGETYITANAYVVKPFTSYNTILDVSSDMIRTCVETYKNNNNIKIIDEIISNGKQGVVKHGCFNGDQTCDRYIIKISFKSKNEIENINRIGEVHINNILNNFREHKKININSPKLLGFFACPIYNNENIKTTINSMREKGIKYDSKKHTYILYQVYETVVKSKISPKEMNFILSNCKYNVANIFNHNIFLVNNEIFNLDMHRENMIIDNENNIKIIDYGITYTISSYLLYKNYLNWQSVFDNNIYIIDLKLCFIYYSFAVLFVSHKKCFNSESKNMYIDIIFNECIIRLLKSSNVKHNENDEHFLIKKMTFTITYSNPYIVLNKNTKNNNIRMFDILTLNLNNGFFIDIVNEYINLYKIFGEKIYDYINDKNNNLEILFNDKELLKNLKECPGLPDPNTF